MRSTLKKSIWALLFAVFLIKLSTIPAQALTIMAMGDSITIGADYLTGSAGGYRDPLYQDLSAAGVSFTFVGANSSSTSSRLTAAGQQYHNGYGSWHIQDLDNNIDGQVSPIAGGDSNLGGYFLTGNHGTGRTAVYPDILLLHIGTNDLLQGNANIKQNLSYLVTHIHALTPNTVILIAGIIPINSSGFVPVVQSYNAYIRNTLVPSLSYTRYVDQNSGFLNQDGTVNGALLGSDNVHPNRFGYPIIASQWATAIKAVAGVGGTGYPLSVSNGTGSGSYPAGSVVTINANAPQGGSQFANWTPATTALSNPYSSVTTYIMPAAAANLTAKYSAAASPVLANGTYEIASFYDSLSIASAGVANGSAGQQQSYTGAAVQKWDLTNLGGNIVTLTLTGTSQALEIPAANVGVTGATLDVSSYTASPNQQWIITPDLGSTQIINAASGQAINIQGYSTSSGSQLVQYTAGYIFNQLWSFFPVSGLSTSYLLTVNNGSGSGSYTAGSVVSITANSPGSGYQFAGWTGTTVSNPSSPATTITMPSSATSVTATYSAIAASYSLTVNSGSGSGTYSAGQVVAVTAGTPLAGYQFAGWTGATGALANAGAASTTLTMPATTASITATYSPTYIQSGTTGATVSVQFMGGGASPLHGAYFDYTAGAASFAAGHWNPVVDTGNTTSAQNVTVTQGLTDSTGAASGLGFHLVSSGAYYTGAGFGFTTSPVYPGFAGQRSGAGDAFLYAGFAYAGYSDANPVTLAVTGLNPGDSYDLLVYLTPFEEFGNSQSATIGLAGGPTYYLKTNGNAGTYKRIASTTPGAATSGNYVEYDGLTGSASQTITLVNTSQLVGISGFQIVDTRPASGSYSLTVSNGSGSGTYPAGTAIAVTAGAPLSGYQFAGWTGATSVLANPAASTTILTMPAAASSITATYSATYPQTGVVVNPTVSIQFIGGGAAPLHSAQYDYIAGAGSFATGHWNPLVNTGNTTIEQNVTVTRGLTDSTGAASALGFQLVSSGAYYTGAGLGFTSSPPYAGYPGQLSGPGDAFLYAGFAYAGYSDANPMILTVTGLNPSDSYALLVYVSPFEGFGDCQSASINLAGGSTYYLKTNGTAKTYQRITSTTPGAPTLGNYVEFDNVTGAGSQTMTLTNRSNLVGVSGFQIVDLTVH